MFKRIDERTLVAGQIRPEDLAKAKAEGVTMIVNNRPDGEQAGQPSSAEMEAAAKAAGLDYRYIPIRSSFPADRVQAMSDALEEAEGRVLAYCLSGTRSTFLWALARASQGDDGEELIEKAAAAGYNLSAIRPLLQR